MPPHLDSHWLRWCRHYAILPPCCRCWFSSRVVYAACRHGRCRQRCRFHYWCRRLMFFFFFYAITFSRVVCRLPPALSFAAYAIAYRYATCHYIVYHMLLRCCRFQYVVTSHYCYSVDFSRHGWWCCCRHACWYFSPLLFRFTTLIFSEYFLLLLPRQPLIDYYCRRHYAWSAFADAASLRVAWWLSPLTPRRCLRYAAMPLFFFRCYCHTPIFSPPLRCCLIISLCCAMLRLCFIDDHGARREYAWVRVAPEKARVVVRSARSALPQIYGRREALWDYRRRCALRAKSWCRLIIAAFICYAPDVYAIRFIALRFFFFFLFSRLRCRHAADEFRRPWCHAFIFSLSFRCLIFSSRRHAFAAFRTISEHLS